MHLFRFILGASLLLAVRGNTETYFLTVPKDFLQEEYHHYLELSLRHTLVESTPTVKLEPDQLYELTLPSTTRNTTTFELDLIPLLGTASLADRGMATRDVCFFVRLCWHALSPVAFSLNHLYAYTEAVVDGVAGGPVLIPKILLHVHHQRDGVDLQTYARVPSPVFDLDVELRVAMHIGTVGGRAAVMQSSFRNWALSAAGITEDLLPLLGYVLAVMLVGLSAQSAVLSWLVNS